MATIIELFENITRSYVYIPIIAAIIIGAICALIGVFIVLRKLVFLVDGIAHSAFAGGALGVLLSINPIFTIGAFGLTTAVSMAYINEKGKISNETAVGIMFSFTMALGIIFIGLIKTYTTGISSLLFGSVVLVGMDDFILIVIIGIIVTILTLGMKKELFFATFDEELAKANGMPNRVLNYIFLIMTALVIVVSMKIIGVILLLSLIVTPAATAYQITYKLNRMIIYSVLIATFSSFFGYIIAYLLEVAASASIVVVLTIIFVLTMTFSPKRRAKKTITAEDYCELCEKAVGNTEECKFCEITGEVMATHTDDHNHNHNNNNNNNNHNHNQTSNTKED